jgi:hypothetical protein
MPETAKKPAKRKTTRQEKITKPAVYETEVEAPTPAKKPVAPSTTGRPTTFNQKTADLICMMLSEGMSLRQILKADKVGVLPAQSTVYEWLLRHPSFAEQYTRAREEQADTNADEILDIADEMPPEYTDKDGKTSLDQTYIAWQKNRIEARKWTAAKLRPKKYGDRVALEGVEGGAAIKTEDTNANKFLDIIRNMEMTKRAG